MTMLYKKKKKKKDATNKRGVLDLIYHKSIVTAEQTEQEPHTHLRWKVMKMILGFIYRSSLNLLLLVKEKLLKKEEELFSWMCPEIM